MPEPLTWDNVMELVMGTYCVVDISNNPRTRYLVNDACVMAEREKKTAETTKGVSVRGGGPIQLVSGRAMGNEWKLTVYNN